MTKNKRGDIPVTILVMGVVAICILAIVSFYISDRDAKKGFDIELVEKAAVIGEKISFYKESLEFSEEEINEIFEVKPSDGLGKHLLLEQEGIRVRYNIP
ncbi:hypothetical protein J4422_03405 [Candidatus Pacearchaeota archaeon]|nr:hypothetical protein [Candidatus Pacearchaeota archaeon]